MIQSLDVRFTRNLFLRCVSAIYLFAFASIYIQIPGLYGNNGVLPARTQLDFKEKDYLVQMQKKPTLLWFAPYLGLNVEYMMDLLCIVGMFCAFSGFISQKFCVKPTFAALWSLYYSVYQVGQTFMWFQWDILLLETGFLCFLLSPIWLERSTRKSKGQQAPPPSDSSLSVTMWLVKWLLFRLMFSSGVVKLTSGCPSWWGLTALKVHFESMCLPTPLAWYSHHLPDWFLKINTVFAIVAECALPILFFAPIRPVRSIAFLIQVFLQVSIILTGNFTFFNYLTLALCLSLVDDSFFFKGTQKKSGIMSKLLSYFLTMAVYGGLIYGTAVLFGFKLINNGYGGIESKIKFTNKEFDNVLKKAILAVGGLGAASLSLTCLRALKSSLVQPSASFIRKLFSIFSTLFYILVAALLFADSLVPLSSLHPQANATLLGPVKEWHSRLSHLHLTNSYGLFRRITGVGGRPEVIIEGANSLEGPWLEYHFKYKPGHLNKSLPIVAPHQPRLDWQMWFAALGTYHQNPWIMSLTYRLLSGQPEVLALLSANENPFPKAPPKFIRASFYHYHYTTYSERNSDITWSRHKVNEYFPVFSKNHPPLIKYLNDLKILSSPQEEKLSQRTKEVLDSVRRVFSGIEPELLMLSLVMTGFAAMFIGLLLPTSHKQPPPPPPKQEKRRKK